MTVKSLLVKIGADTSELEKGLATAQSSLERHKSTLLKTGAALTALGGAMTAFFANAVKGAADQEKAEALLVQMLKNVKGAREEGAKALIEQAQALQALTGYQDEEIIQAQAMLATFQLTDEQIKEITPRLLDMAAATEKSTGAKADLQSIAIALGKGFTGMTGQLARYGVVLSEEAKTTKDFNLILKSLDMNFKGAAETAGKTLAGQLKIAKASFGDVIETIGAQLIPVLTPLLQSITSIITSIVNWLEKNKALMSVLVPLAAAVGALALVLGPIIAGLPLLAAGFSMLTGPIGIVIAAVTGLITIGSLIIANWQKVKEFLLNIFASILSKIASVVGVFAPKLKESLMKSVESLRETSGEASAVIQETMETIKTSTVDAATATTKTIQELSNTIISLKKTMTDEIKKLTLSEYEYAKWAEKQKYLERKAQIEQEITDETQKNEMLRLARQAYSLALKEIEDEERKRREEKHAEEVKREIEIIDKMLQKRQEWLNKMAAAYSFLQNKIAEYTEIINQNTMSEFDFKSWKLDEWYQKEKETLMKSEADHQTLKEALSKLDEAYYAQKAALAKEEAEKEKSFAEELAEALRDIYFKIAESLMDAFEEVGRRSKTLLEAVQGIISNVFAAISSTVKKAMAEWVGASLKAALSSKTQALAALIASVMKLPFPANLIAIGGALATLYAIFRKIGLAEGGIVTKPTLAVVGEKGKEAVLPLKQLEKYFVAPMPAFNQSNYFYGEISSGQSLEEISAYLARRTMNAIQRGRR